MNDVNATDRGMEEAFRIDEGKVREHVDHMVRQSVEQTLNSLLEVEADALCGAGRYERTDARKDTRAGSYTRKLATKAGQVKLKVPRLRSLPFETQIIERYRRRESSVEEALIEMYLAGVSVRRVEDITEALWGTRVSEHRQRAEPEGVRTDRRLAEQADRGQAPVCLLGRDLPQALVGRGGEERGDPGGHRRGRGRLP